MKSFTLCLFFVHCVLGGFYGNTENVDRSGGDLPDQPLKAANSQDCETKCFLNRDCSSWAFDSCGDNCWLKGSRPGISDRNPNCRISGNITAARPSNNCLFNRLNDVKSGRSKVRGGNLGSWFLQEGWMVGWLWNDNGCAQDKFPGTYLLEQCLGSRGQNIFNNHWNTFVTEDEFKVMASYNLNAVRLPIGWWHIYDTQGGIANAKLNQYVTPTNYLEGSLKYIDKAFEWGEKWGIAILLDIHGAPGSQNGEDHSAAPVAGQVYWDKYPANQAQTLDSVELYAQRYAGRAAFFGICLMNEPKTDTNVLKKYYQDAYSRVRRYSKNGVIVINPLITNQNVAQPEWTEFMNPPQYNDVWMSVHWYHIWGFEGKSDNDKLSYIKWDRNGQISEYAQKNPKKGIIDEWSNGGITDGRAAMQAQIEAFNKMNGGWTFWSWSKTWGGDSWSLRTAFEKGWILPDQTGIGKC